MAQKCFQKLQVFYLYSFTKLPKIRFSFCNLSKKLKKSCNFFFTRCHFLNIFCPKCNVRILAFVVSWCAILKLTQDVNFVIRIFHFEAYFSAWLLVFRYPNSAPSPSGIHGALHTGNILVKNAHKKLVPKKLIYIIYVHIYYNTRSFLV